MSDFIGYCEHRISSQNTCPECSIAMQERIAALEKVAEAATEWFGPSLQDARFETVAIIKALREAGYTYTTQEESK